MRSLGKGEDPDAEHVSAHLTSNAAFADCDWDLEEAADTMAKGGFRHLVVVDGGNLVRDHLDARHHARLAPLRAPRPIARREHKRAWPFRLHTMTSVAVVGGGFGGVGAAAMLARAGYRDVIVFEKAERLGGVWHHNTYPGAACDIPSHLYEFSFAPNPRWSRRYAPQEEIQAYIEDVARRSACRPVRLSTEVTSARWDDDAPLDARDERRARTRPTC